MDGKMGDEVNHPAHYGGAEDPYEAIKVICAWDLNFNLGNAVKYIRRAGHKVNYHSGATLAQSRRESQLEDLKKARFYLDYEIQLLEKGDGDGRS